MDTNTQEITDAEDQQLYNLVMIDIEPDLTTDMLPLLEGTYSWETAEEKEGRMNWYREALEMCMERLSDFVDAWSDELETVKKVVKSYVHGFEEKQQSKELSDIEDSLDAQ